MSIFERIAFSEKSDTTYGLAYVEQALWRHGHSVEQFDKASSAPILASLYWKGDVYDLIRWRKRYGVSGRKITAGGLQATCYPNTVLPFVDEAYLGDGEVWDGESRDHILIGVPSAPVEPAVAEYLTPVRYEEVQVQRRGFCEISRGCKNKCFFCQYAWVKPYREASIVDIKAVLARTKTRSIRMFAADRHQHSRFEEIQRLTKAYKKHDNSQDVSVKYFLSKGMEGKTWRIRTGIEGMSARLRKMVAKPLSDEDIVECMGRAAEAGITGFDWYMIYGLPTETEEDWQSFVDLIRKISKRVKRITIGTHWTAFSPQSMTPMQWCATGRWTDRRLDSFLRAADYGGAKVVFQPLMTARHNITYRAMAMRATPECAHIIRKMASVKSFTAKNETAILDEYKRVVGVPLHDAWPLDKPLPWDPYVAYDKAKLARVARKAFNA